MEEQPYIFLDRDGIVNYEEDGYTWKIEECQLVDGLVDFMNELKRAGYRFAVITNQSGIAKGIYEHENVERVHDYLASLLEKEGLEIDAWYYCPHHPDFSECLCRKPSSLLLEKAVARFGVNKEKSWMIGDQKRDTEAGEAIGLNPLLVKTNEDLRPYLKKILA